MCLLDGQRHNGGNGAPPQSHRNGEFQGELPGLSIRSLISLIFSPHETLDDRLIEVPYIENQVPEEPDDNFKIV